MIGTGILRGTAVTARNFVGSYFDKERPWPRCNILSSEIRCRSLKLAPFTDHRCCVQRLFEGDRQTPIRGVYGTTHWIKNGIVVSSECHDNYKGRRCVGFEMPL